MPPLVSVVVSTRNQAGTLAAMVEAVLAQEIDAELELVVVNDASTDATQEVMNAFAAEDRVVLVSSDRRLGAAGGRNLGLERARGAFIAFTDSDCVPEPGWVAALLGGFDSARVGIVQGRTTAPAVGVPLFSHHIETPALDGSFSTSNVAYRREALGEMRFDVDCDYWEDVDLGWRVMAGGWEARFAAEAVVRHQVVPLTALRWLMWPRRFANWPAKAARYPDFRRHLFLGVWVRPIHMWFDLALVGLALGFVTPWALILLAPYLVEFVRTRGLGGRFPPAKAAAHLAWDVVALGSLLVGSARYRALVL